MPLRIAHLPSSDKLSHVFSFPVLQEIYPADLIGELLSQQQTWEQRERKLSQFVMVYLLIAWPLFLNQSLRSILLRLTSSLRLLGQLSLHILPSRAALSYRRKQLGVRLLRTLMRRVCRPRASHQTPGAFAFGLRLMGIDGTLEDLADTEENAAFFGRTSSGDTRSPYPQMRCVHLVEIGTHAIVDTMAAPCHADEHRLGWGLLRSLGQDMLLLFDRGFVAAAFLEAVLARGTQVLARLAQGIFLHREQVLPDSSYLTTLDPRHCVGLQAPLQVRISTTTVVSLTRK